MQVTGMGAIIGFDRPTQMKSEKPEMSQNSSEASSSSLATLSKSSTKPTTKNEKPSKKSTERSKASDGNEVQSFENVLAKTSAPLKPEVSKALNEQASDAGVSASVDSMESRQMPGAALATVGRAISTNANGAARPEENAGTDAVAAAIQAALMGQAATVSSGEVGAQEIDAESLLGELQDVVGNESALRQDSMQLFLNRMKEEFGVEPGKIIKAFASLDQAMLKASPEQTAENVLEQLNLQPEQMPKAERYYREMLLTTGESALNEQLAGAQIGAALGVSVKILSEKEEAMQKLEKAIASLNDSFAMRTPVEKSAAIPAEVSAVESSVSTQSIEEKPSKFESIAQALGAASAAPVAAASAGKSGSDSSGDSSSKQPKSQSLKAVSASTLEKTLEEASLLTMPTTSGEKAAVPLAAGSATSASLAQAMLKQGDGAAPENVQDVVRNAQLLVQKGGGEMKMQLRPEGLGEVHLKVAVKDGQVAIQMMTDTDSAKRALEKGLDDLKTNLASHRLQVDALKVDVNTDLAKQRFEQGNQDLARDQARQMAQDFMGQFRQDREGFRQGFSEGFGMGSYQQPRRQPVPEADGVATSSVPGAVKARSATAGGDRRLNLVA